MSSNPFRRKATESTPSASGRTSLDIDEERLHQVAQQAFAVEGEDIEGTGSPGSQVQARHSQETGPIEATTNKVSSETRQQEEAPSSPVPQVEGIGGRTSIDIDKPAEASADGLDTQTHAHTPPPPSVSSAGPTRSSSTRSAKPPPPPPPPSRTSAPPAPPRPRRSVKRPREETPRANLTVHENAVSVNVVPASPTGDEDPFAESKLRSLNLAIESDMTKSEREIERRDESKNLQEPEAESEYEEASSSGSEASEVPSAKFAYTSKPLTAEPETVEDSNAGVLQAPNPFRKRDENDEEIKQQSSETDKMDISPPPIRFGVQRTNSSNNPKAARQSMDVDAFKHLMLTGQSMQIPDAVTGTTDAGNFSKQSLAEGIENSYTPRSSQDTGRSTEDLDSLKVLPSTATSPTPKAKPPPPKPRGQRNSVIIPPPPAPRTDAQSLASKDFVDATNIREPIASTSPPRASKPPIPAARRISAQILNFPEVSSPIQSSLTPSTPPPPPPPPSRRSGSSPKAQPTSPPTGLEEQPPSLALNISASGLLAKKPEPPPARRSSKRLSAPPSRLQAFAETTPASTEPGNSPSTGAVSAIPPPPPTRKKSYLSQSTTEGESTPEPQPRTSSSFDILDDLSKLQKEIDQLMGKV